MIANGATAYGNDDPETRRLAEALARGGYLVMLPEFPFLKEVRFDRAATDQMDAAFALLRASSETRDRTVGAFGSSVGAGMLLAAAGSGAALARADYVVVLGTYYDMDTYLASVASATQLRAGRLEPWSPDPVVRDKLPAAARDAMDTDTDRAALRAALDAGAHDVVLARLRVSGSSADDLTRAAGATVQALLAAGALRSKDILPPYTQALQSAGRRGNSMRLRYRLYDDSGKASVALAVHAASGRVVASFKIPLRPVAFQSVASVAWKVPRTLAPGQLRVCLTATDPSGNRSRKACEAILVT